MFRYMPKPVEIYQYNFNLQKGNHSLSEKYRSKYMV